jgi:hypothetical protein
MKIMSESHVTFTRYVGFLIVLSLLMSSFSGVVYSQTKNKKTTQPPKSPNKVASSTSIPTEKREPAYFPERLDIVPSDYVSSNKEDTIFKGRLYWPKNTTIFPVKPIYDWDNFTKNPSDLKFGGHLPYYGAATPIEVNDDINAVWNFTKNIHHIQGEKLESLTKRIQAPVSLFIQEKNQDRIKRNLPPLTKAHMQVLRAAANETFVMMNMESGRHGLSKGPVVEPCPCMQMTGGPDEKCKWNLNAAQQLLDQPKLIGSCGYHQAVLMALHHRSGIFSVARSGKNRPPDWKGGYIDENNSDTPNHAWVGIILESNNDARGISKKIPNTNYSDSPAVAHSDPTFYSFPLDNGREPARKSKVMPHPEHVLVGAKGDTCLNIRYALSYMEANIANDKNVANFFVDWSKNIYKEDVSSVLTLIKDGNKLNEAILSGK